MTTSCHSSGIVLFPGHADTGHTHADGSGLDSNAWYWCPVDHTSDVVFDGPYFNKDAAEKAARAWVEAQGRVQ